MPGYVLVQMEMTDDAWGLEEHARGHRVRGLAQQAVPLSQPEVDRLLHKEVPAAGGAPSVRVPARSSRWGRPSRSSPGPLSDFSGEIAEINEDAAKLKVAGLDLWPRDAGRSRL